MICRYTFYPSFVHDNSNNKRSTLLYDTAHNNFYQPNISQTVAEVLSPKIGDSERRHLSKTFGKWRWAGSGVIDTLLYRGMNWYSRERIPISLEKDGMQLSLYIIISVNSQRNLITMITIFLEKDSVHYTKFCYNMLEYWLSLSNNVGTRRPVVWCEFPINNDIMRVDFQGTTVVVF
jgi:hypothetical protein